MHDFKTDRKFLRVTLFLFLTMVIMNSIKFMEGIETIGRIGKVLIALAFLFSSVFFIKMGSVKLRLNNRFLFMATGFIILCFAFYAAVFLDKNNNLLVNIFFPVYFIFYYLLCRLYLVNHINKRRIGHFTATKFDVFKTIRFTLIANLVIWFTIAYASGVPMKDGDGFGGFFQDEIHFGLYATTGFLTSFYLRYNRHKKDKSIVNSLLLVLYTAILLFTSRNSLFIVLTSVSIFFVLKKFKNKALPFLLPILTLIIINYDYLFKGVSVDTTNALLSGRFEIWRLALSSIGENSIFFGFGLFNANEKVLYENTGTGFYYLDSLESLSFHSSYLELYAAGGIIAFILFFVIIFRTWSRLDNMEKSIAIGILFGAIFESYLMQPFMLISAFFYFIIFTNNFKIAKSTLNRSAQYPKPL